MKNTENEMGLSVLRHNPHFFLNVFLHILVKQQEELVSPYKLPYKQGDILGLSAAGDW